MDAVEPAVAELLGFGPPRVGEPLRAEIVAVARGPRRPDELRQLLQQASEARFALAQRLGGALVIGDVAERCHNPRRSSVGGRNQADLDPHPAHGAVLADGTRLVLRQLALAETLPT